MTDKYEVIGNIKDLIDKEELERKNILVDSIRDILPKKLSEKNKDILANELVEGIETSVDESIKEQYKNNLITYSSVMASGSRVKVDDYLNAVMFITYRNSGMSIRDSFCLVKAEDIEREKINGDLTEEKIINRANAFAQNKIVKDIQSQNQLPLHIVFGDILVDGIRRMHDVILHGKDRDAIGAFDSLARNLLPKEQVEVQIDSSILDKKIEEYNNAKLDMTKAVIGSISEGGITLDQILSKANSRKAQQEAIEGELV